MHRRNRGLVFVVLAALTTIAHAQPATVTLMVHVYRDRFEIAGRVYRDIDEIDTATRGRTFGYSLRECNVDAREREIVALILARAGEAGEPFVNVLREVYPLECG